MRRLRTWATIGLLLGLCVWLVRSLQAAELPELSEHPQPGRYRVMLKVSGYERSAEVLVPRGYDPAVPPSLVLALHGAGGRASSMLDQNHWAEKGNAAGFLVVAPQGLPARPRLEANFVANPALWNSGQLPAGSPRAQIDDVAFIRALLDHLQQQVPYRADRVFCTGHSNGGGMTFRLAAEMSDRLTAVATVAGIVADPQPAPLRPLPTLYIYGRSDPLLPEQGGESQLPWGARTTAPVADYLKKWAQALGCRPEPELVAQVDDVERLVYRSEKDGPTLTVLRIHGHGHAWPGGVAQLPERRLGPNRTKFSATDEIWKFFASTPEANRDR